jgi:hypothetical protein
LAHGHLLGLFASAIKLLCVCVLLASFHRFIVEIFCRKFAVYISAVRSYAETVSETHTKWITHSSKRLIYPSFDDVLVMFLFYVCIALVEEEAEELVVFICSVDCGDDFSKAGLNTGLNGHEAGWLPSLCMTMSAQTGIG